MPTDDERREVAARLRGWRERVVDFYTLSLVIEAESCLSSDIADRLADLIEPPTQCPYYHSDRHYCSVHDDVVDRDALLALADELANVRRWSCYADSDLLDIADRIREAIGAKDADD